MHVQLRRVGVIGSTHGHKGKVHVTVESGNLEEFAKFREVFNRDGAMLEVIQVKPRKEDVIVKFRGIDHMEQAKRLKGLYLYA